MTRLLLALGMTLLAVLALALPAADAVADEGLERARALVEEARPFNQASGDPDASTGERKKARREAHDRLVEARALYDAYMDAHPSEVESLDREYCDCVAMLYWIRKMASVNEFDRDPAPELPGGDREEPANEGPSADRLRRDWARETLAGIREEERRHPGDVPRLHALYEKYLAQFPDPSYEGFDEAARRLGELAERLKSVFKEKVGADPEALDGVDSDEAEQIARNLGKMLKSGEDEERRRAAELMGATASGAGAYDLCKALDDRDGAVAQAAGDALARIGGTRVAYNLVKMYRDDDAVDAGRALDVLRRAAAKSEVDSRTLAPFLGRFVLAKEDEVANAALDALVALGPAAGEGLVEAIGTKDIEKKKRIMWAIAEARYHDGTKAVANYLVQGDGSRVEPLRQAAIDALKQMKPYCVPHLIDLLQSRKHRLWSAWVLRDITGQRLGANSAREWRAWWDANKPADAE